MPQRRTLDVDKYRLNQSIADSRFNPIKNHTDYVWWINKLGEQAMSDDYTKCLLRDLHKLCVELQSTSSSNDKIAILKKHLVTNCQCHKDMHKLIKYIYHPTYQFYVTSDNLIKKSDLTGSSYIDIFDLLDDLRLRKITGHDAIGAINTFVSNFPTYKELIHCIIDKDLKTRAGDKIINKVVPDLIPIFEVALADNYHDVKNIDWSDGWYVSRKIDGVRCIAIVDEHGNTTFFSRQGKPFNTLNVVADEIKKLGIKNVIFDGELCLINDRGMEDFQGIMKEIRKKDHSIPNPSYKLFDVLSHNEFYRQKGDSNNPFGVRLRKLKEIINKYNGLCLTVLEQTIVESEITFENLIKEYKQNGWEGLMIRADKPYKGKRSKDLLKYKSFLDAEYEVVDAEMGAFRYIKDGKEHEETMLSNIIIRHKNNLVGVGSGFSVEQRKDFYKNPEKIVGKVINVQYFEETINKEGEISLRFPTFKYLFGEVREF